ncbi:unnamed protein product [Soboliphyme baturini]|uniref:MRP-L46 domain-containing protein n=1 Tax=Soboliphyme baturini TaxID=241478 RepID=A0A183J1I2_9BILA|nr:unnamed protein product [Soboliphyme baturini]
MLKLRWYVCHRLSGAAALSTGCSLAAATKPSKEAKRHCPLPDGKPDKVEKWDVCAAVCLERFPVLAAPMDPMQEKMTRLLDTIETQRSLYSPFELRHMEDLKHTSSSSPSSAKNKGKKATNEVRDKGGSVPEAAIVTAQDFEDACDQQLALFRDMFMVESALLFSIHRYQSFVTTAMSFQRRPTR